jgi:histidyl-tRNA synthetase
LAKANTVHLEKKTVQVDISIEKALRYDLTVPFARYVVQHQNDIEFLKDIKSNLCGADSLRRTF